MKHRRMILTVLALLATSAQAGEPFASADQPRGYDLGPYEQRVLWYSLPMGPTPQIATGNACVTGHWVLREQKPAIGQLALNNICGTKAAGVVRLLE